MNKEQPIRLTVDEFEILLYKVYNSSFILGANHISSGFPKKTIRSSTKRKVRFTYV